MLLLGPLLLLARPYERADSSRVLRRGHYLTVWRREPDGSWRYILDLGSPRPPLPNGR